MAEFKRVHAWALLIKPTEDCNLNCQYCYAKPFREKYGKQIMTMETLEKIISMAENYAEQITIIWHGGEPTLAGVDWYYKAQEVLKRHPRSKYTQSMQSNGTTLDESWAKLVKDTGINIGISFDVFDQKIRTSKMQTIEDNLKVYLSDMESIGVISVINKANYTKQTEIYDYFKNNFNRKLGLSFNHIFKASNTKENNLELTSEEYASEFSKIFKHILHDSDPNAIAERTCSTFIKQIMGDRQLVCTYCDCACCWMGITVNGDIYPCDRYIPEKYKLGNIYDYDYINDAYNSRGYNLYVSEKKEREENYCKKCGYLNYCQGECNASHIMATGDNAHIDEIICNQFKKNFVETYKILKELDIYKDKINPSYFSYFIDGSYFTFKEIKNILFENSLNIPEIEDLNEFNLLDSIEFKIFRLFNLYRGLKNDGHSDYVSLQYINTDYDDLDAVYKNRYNNIKLIFDMQKEKIIKLLGGGD